MPCPNIIFTKGFIFLSPEVNSIAERMLRTIFKHCFTMLWAAVIKTAVFLTNRSPASALDGNMTPYEAYFGYKPNLGCLKVWG